MSNRLISITQEEPRHRKRSKKKGRTRSDHKHSYKIVVLHTFHKFNFTDGTRFSEQTIIAKVCEICGRIMYMSWNEKNKYCYDRQLFSDSLIEEKTRDFEHWYSYGFDSIAYRNKEVLYEKVINSN